MRVVKHHGLMVSVELSKEEYDELCQSVRCVADGDYLDLMEILRERDELNMEAGMEAAE